ncbi:MAG: hypothetical protein MJY99_06730, partial [Fibrobacter sp.]|nr:hypothetical protein [Fibrobacter sp.]
MMKTSIFKKMAFALLFVLMFSSMSFAKDGDLGGGTCDGSSSKPYQISDADDLKAFAKLVNDGVKTGAYAVLTTDIDMNQGKTVLDGNGDLYNNGEGLETWTPIGTSGKPYMGTFDGNGHTIRGLYFNDEKTFCVGLFGYINESAKVQNVGVVDSYFKGSEYIGGVVGYNDGGTVSNVYNTGSVSGDYDVGGVVGNNYGTVSNVYNTGSVSGDYEVGGVVGNNFGTVRNVYNTGSVSGDYEVGGVVGNNFGTVSNAYNTGSVSGSGDDVGGVVGYSFNGTVSNVYNTGSVSGNGVGVGGVVGFSFNGTVSNAYNTGSVSGSGDDVGGVVGMNDNGIVSNVYYNTGTYYGRAVGFGEAGTNVGGKTTAELASLVVESAFPQDADIQNPWTAGDIEGSVCKLPYLTGLGNQPQIEVVSVTINDINGNAELKTVTIPSGSRLSLAGVQMEDYGVFSLYKKVDDEFVEWNFEDGVKNDIELWAKYIRVVDGVYQISNADELLGFASIVNSGETDIDGKLTADICLNACEEVDKPLLEQIAEKGEGNLTPSTFNQWTPIGTEEKQFVGKFDGNGKTVRGLYFNDENAGYVGLFGYVGENGVVQNVGVVDSYLRGFWAVGGVVGFNGSGTVSNVYNTGSVNGTGGSVGGVVGYNVDGSVSNVYNTGSVSGYYEVGGVVGGNYSGGTVSNVYNTGSVSGSGNVGGVVGFNYYGTVSNVYNTGSVNGTDGYVGGVVGGMDGGDINKAYYDNQTCNNCNSYGTGKALAELATLTIGSKADADFPLLEGEMESPWAKGIYYDKATGKLANSELPYLKSLPKPQDVEMEFNVKDNVIQISSAEDLKNFARLVNEFGITDADAELTTNLTVNSNLLGEGNKNVEDDGTFNWEAYRTAHNWNEPESWSPIGTGENPYQGTFNGNNKTVSGVFNSDGSNDVGFFGRVGENGVVKNVGVVDSYINCNMYCGGIVGENDGSVSGVSYAGVVYGGEEVGGIIGKNNGGASVRNVYKTGAVYGSNLVGGIVGDNGASINNAFNMGTVSGSDNVGGVAGQNSGSVSKAYYNTDFYAGNGIGMSYGLTEDVLGKSTADLAALDVSEAFPQNEGEENPWANDISYDKATGKLTSTLPYLKNFPVVPDAETILSFTVASGVIQISTAEDLKNFARLVNEFGITDANAELTTSITLNSNLLGENNANVDAETGEYTGSAPANVWTPIGTDDAKYTGTFDGNGHTIRGLYFNDEKTFCVGLFGYINESAKVQNVGVVDSYFKGFQYVGGVVGYNDGGIVSNVYN